MTIYEAKNTLGIIATVLVFVGYIPYLRDSQKVKQYYAQARNIYREIKQKYKLVSQE
ncbi:MAG: hypothetical protein PVJ09_02095 [Candidatus Woesebacteria bacterium]|jgi:hypothetical protein